MQRVNRATVGQIEQHRNNTLVLKFKKGNIEY